MAKRQKNGTGSFRTRKNGTVEYRVLLGIKTDGSYWRKSFYGKTEKEAIKKYEKWLKCESNTPIERVQTVGEWAAKWLEIYKKDKVEYSTYRNYEMYVNNHIIPALGRLKFKQVRPAHIEFFFRERAHLSKSAQKHIYIALNGIFKTAAENHFCKENPVKKQTSLSKKENKIKVFSPTQVKKILEDAKKHQYGILVQLLLYTGLRIGELIALQWTDIDFKNNLINIQRAVTRAENGNYKEKTPKSGKERIIGINETLKDILLNLPKKGIYILTDENGHQLTYNSYYWKYNKFFEETNNYYLSPHKCRHTYATYLLKGGADLRVIQSLLGHSNINVTEIYTHIDTDDIKANVVKLSY